MQYILPRPETCSHLVSLLVSLGGRCPAILPCINFFFRWDCKPFLYENDIDHSLSFETLTFVYSPILSNSTDSSFDQQSLSFFYHVHLSLKPRELAVSGTRGEGTILSFFHNIPDDPSFTPTTIIYFTLRPHGLNN